MTTYNVGDVVVAPFPFMDSVKTKPRPILVVSTQKFNTAHEKIMALMITTASRTQWPSDVAISHLSNCNLEHTSYVRMKCFTLDTSLVTKQLGTLHKTDFAKVQKQLKATLAL